MMNKLLRQLQILFVTAILSACSSDGVDLGPTIADLENLPPLLETTELEPGVVFEVDRRQVIDSFRALVSVTAEGGGNGAELRRLADLELESSLDDRISEDPELQQKGLEASRQAITIYEQYLALYPDRPDNDMILYQLSRAYALEAESEKSMAALDQIASSHPDSKYIDEVQFRRGENLFVDRDYVAAEAAYNRVITDYPDSIYFKKSLYKYGWAQFKQERYEDALASYTRLLDINFEEDNIREIDFGPSLSRADTELLEDVVRLVSLSFSYQEDKLYIADYFKKNGQRAYEPLLYLKLGELYLNKNRIIDGTDLYLAYTQEKPQSAHTPVFHQRAIETFQQAGYSDLVLQEKITFVDRYDVNSDYWVLQEPETHATLAPVLVLHMSELATHYHALARRSQKPQAYEVAADWYRRLLASFPDSPDAPRMNFLLAESLYDAKQYPAAIEEYQKTAYDYPAHKDAPEAGYAALVTYDALFKIVSASELLALRQQRIRSAVRFTKKYPDDKRLSAVELQTAQQFYEWKEYPDAIESAERLIKNENVGKPTRQAAWAILADSQFSSANFPAAETAYLSLLDFLPNQANERQPVREQIAASIYKQGELARDVGEHAEAAGHFIRLGQVIPESPKREVADYDAATAYLQLKDWPAAIKQLETFRKRYPRSKQFSNGVTEKLALAYSESGNRSMAAREILLLSALPGTADRKRDLMWRAAELYKEDGQQEKAIDIYQDYVRAYPYPLDRSIELRYEISEHYRARNDAKNLNLWLKDIVTADAAGKSERSARSKYLAATASMELLQPLHRAYHKTRLTIPLKASLKKKKSLMQQSIDAYSKAMQYGVQEVTTEATFQVAEIYHDFARSLMDSQRPAGLDEEQLEEYELLLEEQAFPFEEKAIDIHLANFKRIPQGTYDQPIRRSLEVLGQLMPFRYARAESSDAYVDIQ